MNNVVKKRVGLKRVRREIEQWVSTICNKEEDWSNIQR
jgi:hypothetical protein